MDFEAITASFTLENVMEMIREYRSFGPLTGILLPILEAIIPFLPLFLIVMANASAYGLWLGSLYSWIGACLGAFLVFLIFRKFGQKRLLSFLKNHSHIKKWMDWLDRHGFGPLFLLFCFPFTPSAVVNIVAGLSKVSAFKYILAVSAGKMVMIFTISFVGHDVRSMLTQPSRAVIVLAAIFILWYAGKKLEVKLNKKTNSEHPG